MKKLGTWLSALPLTDPLERRQAHVFQIVLIGWITLASIGVPILMLLPAAQNTEAAPMPAALAMIYGFLSGAASLLWISPVTAFVLLRRGRFKLSVIIATLGLLLSHIAASFVVGITDGSIQVVYQIPIALAGLLAGRRLLLTVACISLVTVIGVGFLQSFSPPMAGFLSTASAAPGTAGSQAPLQTLGLAISFFVAVTILVTILLDRFGSALREALMTALEREAELREIRAGLETSVAERTGALQAALDDVQAHAQEQADLLAQVEQQRSLIKDLSVPVIPVTANTLVMPLVGTLDSTRLRQLQEQSLQALERTSARNLLLDITGVPVVDSDVAQGLLMTVQAARLLGAQVTLVGIRPEVAQTIVSQGIGLNGMQTFSDLQSALAHVPA